MNQYEQAVAAAKERQKQRLADAPERYRGSLERVYTGKASSIQTIKAFCLQCVGYNPDDVTHCTAPACPLWLVRPFQPTISKQRKGRPLSEERKAAMAAGRAHWLAAKKAEQPKSERETA